MSPGEYPLKLGGWRRVKHLTPRAVESARQRAPLAAGKKAVVRTRTVGATGDFYLPGLGVKLFFLRDT